MLTKRRVNRTWRKHWRLRTRGLTDVLARLQASSRQASWSRTSLLLSFAARPCNLHLSRLHCDMLGDDEDVFDSVTWESPAVPTTYEGTSTAASGPGFRQSTSESEDGRGPHDPKWEGYLITSVKDPVKELAETKDAYVSYLVTAKVSPALQSMLLCIAYWETDESAYLLYS